MTTYNFFVMCPEEGFQVFETLDEALDAADERIKCYLADCWSEDVTGVCVGGITHRAKMCDQVFPDGKIDEDRFDEAGDYWDPDWDSKCNYKMMPVEPENPADDVTRLVPTEPTAEMVSEGARYLQIMSLPEREAASVFRAMLAAAPTVEQAPEVAKLVEALDEMIDIAKRVDSWESFPSDPIERAEDAIRAYRKQGGDL